MLNSMGPTILFVLSQVFKATIVERGYNLILTYLD